MIPCNETPPFGWGRVGVALVLICLIWHACVVSMELASLRARCNRLEFKETLRDVHTEIDRINQTRY